MNSKFITFIFISMLALTYKSYSQEPEKQNDLIERIYLHTDKALYYPVETIWFKAYIVSINNEITDISDVFYVDLISPKGKIVSTVKLRIFEGACNGEFIVSNKMQSGTYTMRAYTLWMKNFGKENYFTRRIKIEEYKETDFLINIKFDKDFYFRNSKVKVFLKIDNLKNEVLKKQEVEFQVNISGKKYFTEKISTDSTGGSEIKFSLPDSLNTSDVALKAFVSYKENIDSVLLSVPVIIDNIDLQFLPEGGYMVQNIKNVLAFKALNELGKPINVQAEIINSEGKVCNIIESYHDGMGSFKYTPEKDEKYFAQITKPFVSKKRYKLPESHEYGTLLSLIKNDSSEIKFNVFSSNKTKINLTAKSLDKLYFSKKIILKPQWNEISIPAEKLPIGIIEFTLYDDNNKPQAERLVFANKHKSLKVSIKPDKEIYFPREKVELRIMTTDSNGKPIPSNLSLAVVDKDIINLSDEKQDNIMSFLLMSSYLKGKINNPCFYFDRKESKTEKALDLIMLTHGWRSYIKDYYISFKKAKFKPEQEKIDYRVVVDSKGKPVKATVLIPEYLTDRKVAKIETDETGLFSVKRESGKSIRAIAFTKDNKKVKINYVYTDKEKKQMKLSPYYRNNRYYKKDSIFDYIQTEYKYITKHDLKIKNKIYNRFDSYRKSLVNTYVDKSGMKMESDIDHGHEFVRIGLKKGSLSLYHLISMIYNNFRNDDIENFIPETVSGFNINNPQKGCQNISIRGSFLHSLNYNPIVVINDVPYYNYYNRHKISSILPNKIESIRIIKGNIATGKYGSPATNGVIEIKTDVGNTWGRNSFRLKRPKRIAYHKFYGEREDRNYSETRQFYIPVYDNKNDTSCIRNDFRQTIYWNPIIQTDENGKAKISFYNSDAITSFKIIAEGIGYTGIPGRKEETYNIQKPLSIDVKVPAYLSVGDTLEIPITVSNNTDNIISAAFALNLPEELKTIGNVPTTIKIAPNNISAKFIKILPVKACSSSNILIGIRSLEFEDIFSKEVSIRKFEEEK